MGIGMGRIWGLLLLAPSLVFAYKAPVDSSDSGIIGPPYETILRKMETWARQYPELTEIVDYGVTPQGRPLRLVVVRKPTSVPHRQALLLTGSTHGNEYLNIEDELPALLLQASTKRGTEARFLDEGGVFIFVPIVNPDGYASRSRENSHHIDLNRDWDVEAAHFKGFREPETRSLSAALDRLKEKYHLVFRISVDYHCCSGALLHPWAYKPASLPALDLAQHQHIGLLANRYLNVHLGATGQILKYYALGTAKDYYYEKYGALAFTYEGRFGEENQLLDKHLSWWKDMIHSVTSESSRPLFTLTLSKVKAWFQIAE